MLPRFSVDMSAFWKDPYPSLSRMRASAPICFVPELDAVLITRRDDVFRLEKKVDVFSSEQPGGLMTVLMGENMMRKDGQPHMIERKQLNASVSPTVVMNIWHKQFVADTHLLLDQLSERESCDLVTDYAMPVSANALRHITGLTSMTPTQLDSASQGMIDGISNFAGIEEIEKHCNKSTALIDAHIDEMSLKIQSIPETCLLSTLTRAGQSLESIRANIKLAISGGQNEPRDAIAGTVWALLTHDEQHKTILEGQHSYRQAFEEYSRWISPIGMSPRRITRNFQWEGVEFQQNQRAFLMYSSANRDETVFDHSDAFDIGRDNRKTVSFGAGPHFCPGAWVSRCLIGDVALPMLFNQFPDIRLSGDIEFGGWAFRGPLKLPVNLYN